MSNTTVRSLDLSDNSLTDDHGKIVCSFIRSKCEQRDLDLWAGTLRMYEPETLSKTRVVNSEKTIRKLLGNLDNSNLHCTMEAVLDK